MINYNVDSEFWNIILECNAIREGHFYYTWEYHTKYYIDTDMLFQWPENVEKVGDVLYKIFSNKKNIDYILTPNYRGGLLLAHNIGERFNTPVILLPRNKGIINFPIERDIKGKAVIIDDGINTGNSIKQLLKISQNFGIEIIGVGIFIDRYVKDLEKSFLGLVKSVITLPKEYSLLNITEKSCPLCQKYKNIVEELETTDNETKRKELLGKKKDFELKSAYGDIE